MNIHEKIADLQSKIDEHVRKLNENNEKQLRTSSILNLEVQFLSKSRVSEVWSHGMEDPHGLLP